MKHAPPRSDAQARMLLAFFAALLWQDGALSAEERDALHSTGRELGLATEDSYLTWLGDLPPAAEEVDPQRVPRALASAVLALAALGASVRPSLAKFEALELLESLLAPSAAPLDLDLGLAA